MEVDDSEKQTENPYATPAPISGLPAARFRSEEDGITLEFEVTRRDLEQYYEYQHLHHPQWRNVYRRGWLRSTLALAVCGFATLGVSPSLAVPLLIGSVFFGFFYPWLYRRRCNKTVSLVLDQGRNLGMLGGRRLQLTRQGMYAHTAASEAIVYWPTFELVAEFKDAIYLYISSASAITIPGRVFDSPDQKREFLDYIREMRGDAQASLVE